MYIVFIYNKYYIYMIHIKDISIDPDAVYETGAHFTDNFSITIQLWWTFYSASEYQ